MGYAVKCPACNHRFHVHGYEEMEKCYECNTLFNPKRQLEQRGAI